MNFPDNLLYTKDHEWVRIEGNAAYVGITDFAQSELGDLVYVDISSLGSSLEMHDIFGTIEAVKTVSDLFMPVSGTIVEVNQAAIDNVELVAKKPYDEGWLVKVELPEGYTPEGLLSVADYRQMIGQ